MVPLLISIPGDIEPFEREERFGDPVRRALWKEGRLGRVVGGGTTMCLGGRRFVTGCYVDVDVKDVARALPVLRRTLRDAEAPRGTRVFNCDTDEVLLFAPSTGALRPPGRQNLPPEYPWAQGEVLGYRLSPDMLALLYVLQEGPYPIFRVLDWSGPAVPQEDVLRALLGRREPWHALGQRMYAVGWVPMGLRCAIRLPGRLDETRMERPGVAIPFRQRYLSHRICAFDSWPRFDQLLRQLFGLQPMTAAERVFNELGVGSLAHDVAVWAAPGSVTAEQAYQLFTAFVRKDPGRPAVPPTDALRQFVRGLRAHYARSGEDGPGPPWVGSFRAAEGFMIIPINKSRADEVREVVRGLARQHGLTAYDPHRNEVFVGRPLSGRRASQVRSSPRGRSPDITGHPIRRRETNLPARMDP
jgi:hypothetical protein